MAVNIELETISPKRAQEYLDSSVLKRSVSERTVVAYATLMAREGWEPYPPIEFDAQNHLVNGHHRLHAIIRADVPVKLQVVRGVTPEMHANIDTGRARTMHDLFRMYRPDTDYDMKRAAAVGVCAWLLSGAPQRVRSLTEYDLWVKPFRQGVEWMTKSGVANNRITRASGVSGALAFAHKLDPEKVDTFAQSVIEGAGLKAGSPALTLRNSLAGAPPGRSGTYKMVVARQVLNAVRAFMHNEQMFRVNSDDGGRQFFIEGAYKRAQVKTITMDAVE